MSEPVADPTYEVIDQGTAIRCLRCGMVSRHPEDIDNLWCGYCKQFHEDGEPERQTIQQRAEAKKQCDRKEGWKAVSVGAKFGKRVDRGSHRIGRR